MLSRRVTEQAAAPPCRHADKLVQLSQYSHGPSAADIDAADRTEAATRQRRVAASSAPFPGEQSRTTHSTTAHQIRPAMLAPAEMSTSSARKIYARTGILTHNLVDLAGEHRAVFSIVLVGNQIAESDRVSD